MSTKLMPMIFGASLLAMPGLADAGANFEVNSGVKLSADPWEDQPVLERLSNLALADRTLAFARLNNSVSAYLTAAQMYRDIDRLQSADTDEAPVSAAPDDFWDEAAAALSADNDALARLKRIRQRQRKWLTNGGPIDFRMLPGASGSRELLYNAGEPAVVQLRASDGLVRLTVFDQNGAVACRTEWSSQPEHCRWRPRWKGSFRVIAERQSGRGPIRVAAY